MSPDDPEHLYLGTRLTPAEYYRRHAAAYDNPHADGIAEVLSRLAPHLTGHVLDLGCGDGLATKLLLGRGLTFTGLDNAPGMVARYTAETGYPGLVAGFGEALPPADSAVACYAMHLASPSEVGLMWWRLWEAGVGCLVVATPFKNRPAEPGHYYSESERISGPYGPDGKTIHGRVYTRR